MIVCNCFGISESKIKELIKCGAKSLDDVSRECYAGTDCGTCREYIQEMIDEEEDLQSNDHP